MLSCSGFLLAVLLPSAQAGLTFWDGEGYGDDTYSGEDGLAGSDGRGVEMRGSAGYGKPGNGGNTVELGPTELAYAIFEVVSDQSHSYGRMKLFVCDEENGWQSYVMGSDSSYTGSGHRYWKSLVVGGPSVFGAQLPVTDNISYYFQEMDTFTCLPASACGSGSLSFSNPCASTYSRDFLAAPDATEAVVDDDEDGFSADVDCDDGDPDIFPGAEEVCDGVDNDCDDLTDEADATGATTWYADTDGDGFGDAQVPLTACGPTVGYVDNTEDCNDAEPLAWTGAPEVCDEVDNDCDGETDEDGGCTLEVRDCSAADPCQEGEGDCKGDHTCQAGLYCAYQTGAGYGHDGNVDMCLQAELGDPQYCSVDTPCAQGEGHCFWQGECETDLICRVGGGVDYGFGASTSVCDVAQAVEPKVCSNAAPCGAGEGHCNWSGHCASGLSCRVGKGAEYGLPANTNVCDGPQVGDPKFCSNTVRCGAGEGDCNWNGHCAAGLVCHRGVGASYGFTPQTDVCDVPD